MSDYVVTPASTRSDKWLDNILDEIKGLHITGAASPSSIKTNITTTVGDIMPKLTILFNLIIALLGFTFSIVNTVYLSKIDEECPNGYKSDERKFLYVVSIVLAVFFGMLSVSSIYGIVTTYMIK